MSTITKRFMAHNATCTITLKLPALLGVAVPSIEWTPCPPSGLSQRAAVDLELLLNRVRARIVDEALAAARGKSVTQPQRDGLMTLELPANDVQSSRPTKEHA